MAGMDKDLEAAIKKHCKHLTNEKKETVRAIANIMSAVGQYDVDKFVETIVDGKNEYHNDVKYVCEHMPADGIRGMPGSQIHFKVKNGKLPPDMQKDVEGGAVYSTCQLCWVALGGEPWDEDELEEAGVEIPRPRVLAVEPPPLFPGWRPRVWQNAAQKP